MKEYIKDKGDSYMKDSKESLQTLLEKIGIKEEQFDNEDRYVLYEKEEVFRYIRDILCFPSLRKSFSYYAGHMKVQEHFKRPNIFGDENHMQVHIGEGTTEIHVDIVPVLLQKSYGELRLSHNGLTIFFWNENLHAVTHDRFSFSVNI